MQVIQYSFNDINKNGTNPDTNHDFWIGNVKFWDEIVNAISLRK